MVRSRPRLLGERVGARHLAAMSHVYDDVANGAEYLRRYPAGEYVVPVLDRLNEFMSSWSLLITHIGDMVNPYEDHRRDRRGSVCTHAGGRSARGNYATRADRGRIADCSGAARAESGLPPDRPER